uniref:Uncharacterized protein n=1 Tax=Knipowitschia caucasica TaxID=637954 RepID=A0AAV2MNL9_KNICA
MSERRLQRKSERRLQRKSGGGEGGGYRGGQEEVKEEVTEEVRRSRPVTHAVCPGMGSVSLGGELLTETRVPGGPTSKTSLTLFVVRRDRGHGATSAGSPPLSAVPQETLKATVSQRRRRSRRIPARGHRVVRPVRRVCGF